MSRAATPDFEPWTAPEGLLNVSRSTVCPFGSTAVTVHEPALDAELTRAAEDAFGVAMETILDELDEAVKSVNYPGARSASITERTEATSDALGFATGRASE